MFKFVGVITGSISKIFGSTFSFFQVATDKLTRFDYNETTKIMEAMHKNHVKSYKRGKTEIIMKDQGG